MQTFLPFPDFEESARALDWRRLGKQRVEAWQILRVLRGESKGWRNHPAVRMWTRHEAALCRYGLAVCHEWIRRGYRDTLAARFHDALEVLAPVWGEDPPAWLGRPDFHEAHRSNLIRKDPTFYRERFPDTRIGLPYIWPA